MIRFMQKQWCAALLVVSVQFCYGSYTIKQNEITNKIEEYQGALTATAANKKYANNPNEREKALLALAEEQCLQLIQFKINADEKRCTQDASQIPLLMQNATEYQLGLWNLIDTVYSMANKVSKIKQLQYTSAKRKSYQKMDDKYKEWYNRVAGLDDLYTNDQDYKVMMNNLSTYDDGSNGKESNAESGIADLHKFSKKLVWYRYTLIGIGAMLTSTIGYAVYKIVKTKRDMREKA